MISDFQFTFEVRSRWKSPLEWRYAMPLAMSNASDTLTDHGNSSSRI